MIVNIKNYGAVEDISIDTEKPLTVMCGPNSTGKTYVSYLIYALFSKMLRSTEFILNSIQLPLNKTIMETLVERGSFSIEEADISCVFKAISITIKERLIPLIFAISDDLAKVMFHDFDLDIILGNNEYERIIAKPQSSMWKLGEHSIRMEKKPDSTIVHIEVSNRNEGISHESLSLDRIPYIDKLIVAFMLKLVFGEKGFSRMLTVERNSVYTFSKELALNRSFGIGDLVDINPRSMPSTPERYPMAVTDSLKIAVDLQQIQKNKGYYYEYASQLERNLLNGDIEINENGGVEFVPDLKSDARRHLPIQMTSSIVKTMSSLIIYLKHIANKNDLLIIDEPEMNLHPDNQRLLTCIFAELVNQGLNIIMSTHSDYIIRELNNLVMAKEIEKREITLEVEDHIPYTERQMLDRKNLEVLYFNIVSDTGRITGRKLPVSEFGFDVESIDNAIIAQNRTTHNLADILKYGESNE